MTLAGREGRRLVLGGHPVLMVGTDPAEVEEQLVAGRLACPDCAGALRPWGHARWRSCREGSGSARHRPRRARSSHGGGPPVLLRAAPWRRRAAAVTVLGAALLPKAAGRGHRAIA